MNERTFAYAIRPDPSAPVQRGVIDAKDENDARRLLRRTFGLSRLPQGTRISEKARSKSRPRNNTRTFVYAMYMGPDTPIERGAVEAADEKDARRVLRGVFGRARLPGGTLIFDQNVLCSIPLTRHHLFRRRRPPSKFMYGIGTGKRLLSPSPHAKMSACWIDLETDGLGTEKTPTSFKGR